MKTVQSIPALGRNYIKKKKKRHRNNRGEITKYNEPRRSGS